MQSFLSGKEFIDVLIPHLISLSRDMIHDSVFACLDIAIVPVLATLLIP